MVTHIRYTGSKLKVASQITARFGTDITSYFEGFVGTGCVYLTAAQQGRFVQGGSKVLCDATPAMLAVLNGMRTPEQFEKVFTSAIAKLHASGEQAYYEARDRFNAAPALDPIWFQEMLEDVLILRLGAFQGLWRCNRSGEMNVPYRKAVTTGLVDSLQLVQDGTALNQAQLLVLDFETAGQIWMKEATGRRVAYFDPPYYGTFNAYTAAKFEDGDQLRLIKMCAKMSAAGVHVLLSNSADPVYTRMVQEWWPSARRHDIQVYRSISPKAEDRGFKLEHLYESGI